MKIKTGRLILLLILTFVLAFGAATAGIWFYISGTGRVIVDQEEYETLQANSEAAGKVPDILDLTEELYLRDADPDAMREAAYRAMLDSLGDPYTRYLNVEEVQALRDSLNNNFTGVGITVKAMEGGMTVTGVIAGSPAAAGGLETGDVIVSVDGEVYDTLEALTVAIRGEAGTTVTLEVQRGEESKTRSFKLVRGQINDVTVTSSILSDTVGYIRISSFGEKTGADFDDAMAALEKKDGVTGVIVDLRDNPGGFLDQGVLVADRILPEGLVTYTVDGAGEREDFYSYDNGTSLKVAVLVNGNSASASEMLAAAVLDYGIPVVGTKTYGKGVMQVTSFFPDGSAAAITNAEFFSPEGKTIQGAGVTPSVPVEQQSGKDDQLEKALELLAD